MIRSISWPEIHKIWNTELWPNRTSAIEPNSAMLYLNGYDISNLTSDWQPSETSEANAYCRMDIE